MPKGQWTPPDAGDAPQEVKDILKAVYSAFRDKNPSEDEATKAKGAKIAWGAVHRAGWSKDKDGKWIKKAVTKESAIEDAIAEIEEAAPSGSLERLRADIEEALKRIALPIVGAYPWIRYIFTDRVICDANSKTWQIGFAIKNGVISFGTPVEVEDNFVIKESGIALRKGVAKDSDIDITFISLKEAKYDDKKGEVEVVLIEAGTNFDKKRHYPASTILEAAPNFKSLKMYINHPTKTEEKERPERDLKDWASTIVESHYDNGKAIGVVSVHEPWLRDRLKDPIFREHVGLSINAGGKISIGKVNGQDMEIVEKLVFARKNGPVSVDWVTEPGARGRVSRLLESTTKGDHIMKELENATLVDLKETRKDLVDSIVKEANTSKDAEITKLTADLKEANAKIVKIDSDQKLGKQKEAVEIQLKESKAPDAVKDRVREAFGSTIVEGDLKEAVTKRLASELDYAAKLSGKGKIELGTGKSVDIKESAQADLDAAFGFKKEEKK